MQSGRRLAQHPCHGSVVGSRERASMAGQLLCGFVPVCTNRDANLARSEALRARTKCACPCASGGMVLARSRWQRGQPPAKRFPSRARAGPNAGPAAPPAPMLWRCRPSLPRYVAFC